MFINYIVHILVLICIYLILAVSLQLSIGVSGLMNFGHIAFFALGAYTSAILSKLGVPFLVCFIFAGIAGILGGLIVSLLSKKVKGDYLAYSSLGFSFLIYTLLINLKSVTGGSLGIVGISKPISLQNNMLFFMFSFIILLFFIFIIDKIIKSNYGIELQGMRDNELSMKLLGKNTYNMKINVFLISGFMAGIAGALFAYYSSYIDPSSFTISHFTMILSMVIIAGLGSLRGTVIIGVFLVLFPEILRFLGLPLSLIGPARQIIYSLVLIVIMVVKPNGLFGNVKI